MKSVRIPARFFLARQKIFSPICIPPPIGTASESFICKIAATYAKESVLTAEGKIDYRALKPVLFEMPTYEYLRTGEVIGKCMSFGTQKKQAEGDYQND